MLIQNNEKGVMQMKNIFAVLILLAVVLAPMAAAQDLGTQAGDQIEEATLVTEDNYADALIADSASAHEGAPVLFTEGGHLSSETLATIRAHGIKKLRVLGGPLAISDDVIDELEEEGIEVRRIWGHTRFGTSAELAKDAWPEGVTTAVLTSDHVGRAQGRNFIFANAARQLAQARGVPLFLTDPDGLSSEVVDALTSLGVENVTVVGDEVSDTILTDLTDLGFVVDVVEGITEEELEDSVADKIEDEIRDGEIEDSPEEEFNQAAMVIIAANEWKDALKHMNNPYKRARVKVVGNADEIPDVVAKAQEIDPRKIIIVGFPELAQQINDALVEVGFDPELHVKTPKEVAKEIINSKKTQLKKIRAEFKEHEDEIEARLAEKAADALENAQKNYDRLLNFIEEKDIVPNEEQQEILDKLERALNEAATLLEDGKYRDSIHLSNRVNNFIKELNYKRLSDDEKRDRIEDEKRDYKQLAGQVKQDLLQGLRHRMQGLDKRITDLESQSLSGDEGESDVENTRNDFLEALDELEDGDLKAVYKRLAQVERRLAKLHDRLGKLRTKAELVAQKRAYATSVLAVVHDRDDALGDRLRKLRELERPPTIGMPAPTVDPTTIDEHIVDGIEDPNETDDNSTTTNSGSTSGSDATTDSTDARTDDDSNSDNLGSSNIV